MPIIQLQIANQWAICDESISNRRSHDQPLLVANAQRLDSHNRCRSVVAPTRSSPSISPAGTNCQRLFSSFRRTVECRQRLHDRRHDLLSMGIALARAQRRSRRIPKLSALAGRSRRAFRHQKHMCMGRELREDLESVEPHYVGVALANQ